MQQFGLTGNLREINLEDVLSLLEWGKTGTLAVKDGQEEISLHIVKGGIADAEHSGIPQLTFGEILNRAGYLTVQQLQEISILRLGNQRRIGAVLVELGQVPVKVLEDFLRLRIMNAVRQLFTMKDASFCFWRGVPSVGAGPAVELSIEDAIADGSQYRLEWGKLGGRIRGLDFVVQAIGDRTSSVDVKRLSPTAMRVFGATDGRSSIRMIAQCLFLDDLQAAKAVSELAAAGIIKLTDYQPVIDVQAPTSPTEGDPAEDDLIRLLAKSQVIPASMNSSKPGDRIKALLKVLQDSVNDLLIYQDSQHKSVEGLGTVGLAEEYLEQRFGDILADLKLRYPALDALQVVNRRVDASDLIETYNLILGDTRQTFYMEAVQGLSGLVKGIFDWVLGDEIDNPSIAMECQEAWQLFFQEIEAKVAELTAADGWGKKDGASSKSRSRRGRKGQN